METFICFFFFVAVERKRGNEAGRRLSVRRQGRSRPIFISSFLSKNWSLIYLNNNKVAFISDIVRAIRITARRGSSTFFEHRDAPFDFSSIFFYLFTTPSSTTRDHSIPILSSSTRYQSLKREYRSVLSKIFRKLRSSVLFPFSVRGEKRKKLNNRRSRWPTTI